MTTGAIARFKPASASGSVPWPIDWPSYGCLSAELDPSVTPIGLCDEHRAVVPSSSPLESGGVVSSRAPVRPTPRAASLPTAAGSVFPASVRSRPAARRTSVSGDPGRCPLPAAHGRRACSNRGSRCFAYSCSFRGTFVPRTPYRRSLAGAPPPHSAPAGRACGAPDRVCPADIRPELRRGSGHRCAAGVMSDQSSKACALRVQPIPAGISARRRASAIDSGPVALEMVFVGNGPHTVS